MKRSFSRPALCFLLLLSLATLASPGFSSIGENLKTIHFNSGRPDFGTIPRRMPIAIRGEHDIRPSTNGWGNSDFDELAIDPAFRYGEEREKKQEREYRALLSRMMDLAAKGSWQDAATLVSQYATKYGWTGGLRDRWQVLTTQAKQSDSDMALQERVRRYLRVQNMVENGWNGTAQAVFTELYQDKSAGFLRPYALYRLACFQYEKKDLPVQPAHTDARAMFQRVVKEFPASPKCEDALIMVARCCLLFEEDDHATARTTISTLLTRYPKTRFRRAAEGLLARSDYLKGDYTRAAAAYLRLKDTVSLENTLSHLPQKAREYYYPYQLAGYLTTLDKTQSSTEYEWAITSIDRTLQVMTPKGASTFVRLMLDEPTLAAPYFYYRLYHTADGNSTWYGDRNDEWDYSTDAKKARARNARLRRRRNDSLARLADRIAVRHPKALPPLVCVRLAEVYYRQGNNEKALEWVGRTLLSSTAKDEAFGRALYVQGAVYHRQGQREKAITSFKRLLAECMTSPIRAGAREELALLQEQTGNLGAALDQYFALDYTQDIAYLMDIRMTTTEVADYVAERPQHRKHDLLLYSLGVRYLRDGNLTAARRTLQRLSAKQYATLANTKRHEYDYSYDIGDGSPDPLQVINEQLELNHLIASATTREAKAAMLYREASWLYKHGILMYYNVALWNGRRITLFDLFWNEREERPEDIRAVRRHMYAHEVYNRTWKKCEEIARRYPNTKTAPKALYRGACAVRLLSSMNQWWDKENGRADLDSEAARLMRAVYQQYPKDPLARPARKYARVFAGYRHERLTAMNKYVSDNPDSVL